MEKSSFQKIRLKVLCLFFAPFFFWIILWFINFVSGTEKLERRSELFGADGDRAISLTF